jgi:tetratricopeptide (TPR) repeat protein
MKTPFRSKKWLSWTIVTLLFALLAWPSTGTAQTGAAAADVVKAQNHFERGAEWYTRGDYSKAIVEFLKGNSISPNAMFLYNISLCYGKLNNLENAIQAGEKAIQLGLQASVVPRNQARIAGFSNVLKAKQVSDDLRSREENTRAEALRAGAEAERQNAAIIASARSNEPEDNSSFGVLGWTGVVVTTVGVGLLGAALVMDQEIDDDLARYEQAAEDANEELYSELRGSIQDDQFLGKIFLTSGAATTVMGLIFIIANASDGGEVAWFQIAPQPNGVTFSVTTKFGGPTDGL